MPSSGRADTVMKPLVYVTPRLFTPAPLQPSIQWLVLQRQLVVSAVEFVVVLPECSESHLDYSAAYLVVPGDRPIDHRQDTHD